MRLQTPRVHRRAFTLLEMVIAIALVLALVGSMFAFVFDLLSSRARALDFAAKQRAATTLIERVEADLLCCVVGDQASGAGVEGDATRLRIMARAVAASLAERGAEDPAVFGDLQLAEYRFNDRSGLVEARRGPLGEGESGSTGFVAVGGPVHKVRFRYLDATTWRDSFDSLSADRLPKAVEIAVWFDAWPGDETTPLPPNDEPVDAAVGDRLTFDSAAGFDEQAYARRSDLDLFDEPQPDHIRVIIVPDASPDDGQSSDGGQSFSEGASIEAP